MAIITVVEETAIITVDKKGGGEFLAATFFIHQFFPTPLDNLPC